MVFDRYSEQWMEGVLFHVGLISAIHRIWVVLRAWWLSPVAPKPAATEGFVASRASEIVTG